MSAQHTPGPWLIAGGSTVYALHDNGFGFWKDGQRQMVNRFSASIHPSLTQGCTPGEAEANARLIAAAPDMLLALRRAVLALAFAAESSPAMRDDYEAVSAAISKATGASNA